ncbi:hypothetical protein CRE_13100 [Caenorhabditis remanei]|uniref:Zinc finger PHD-type domain-containing protein n=1 Tax=Caenorhabditis remanei TaxID=31234 RepID=E3NBP9_CAERE|nr:hypothetical protein CRE_13100 [Caenorhabditis remanei]
MPLDGVIIEIEERERDDFLLRARIAELVAQLRLETSENLRKSAQETVLKRQIEREQDGHRKVVQHLEKERARWERKTQVDSQIGRGNEKERERKTEDLEKFLVEELEHLAQNDKLIFDESTGNSIWMCISGDKGGGEFKLCATIGNVVAPNSAYHIVPLDMFTDDEKVEAIKEYLADTIEQLNNLTEIKLNIGGVMTSYPVEQYLAGDLKFQYQMIGHKGAAAKKSCMHCFSDGRVKIGSYERGRCLKARTEADYLLDSANEKNSNSVIPGSAFVFNNVRLANIVPPSLHILMGVAHRYGFKFLLDLAMDIDNKSNTKIDKRDMNVKEKEYNGLKKHLDSFEVVLQVMSRFKTSTIIPAQSHTSPCSAEWCLFRDNEMKKAGVFKSTPLRCATCSEVNHAVCSGLWSEDDWELLSQVEPDMDCLRCCGRKGAMIEEDARKVEREMREKLEELKRELEMLMTAVNGEGEKREELEKAWGDCEADMSAWQQNFTGNHTMKLLQEEAVNHYTSVFPPTDEILHDVMLHHLKQFQSQENMTPKLHLLLEHVLPFMRRHKTWAKTSEQGLEALHAIVNRLLNKYRCTRNKEEQMSQVFCSLLHLGYINSNF